jgi:catechol 2,3-dioxygenase-like lactoylglutathione lyase family enzyme
MSDAGPAAPAGVHHVAVIVRALSEVEAFYREVLMLPVLRRWPADPAGAPGGPERSVWLDAGGGVFLALERAVAGDAGAAPNDQDLGFQMVALRIAASERGAWEQRLASAGVAVYRRTSYTLYVRDPEGNRVGLSHWPHEANA